MFNRAKSVAKKFTWHYLRKAQRVAFNSQIGADPRIDSRKLMVALGAFGIYMNLSTDESISTSQLDQFLGYVFERAPKDIHDLLAEFRLEQLDPNSFKKCYTVLVKTCVESETSGEDKFFDAIIFTIVYSLKDEFNDNENLNYILVNHMDELKAIINTMMPQP